MPLLTQSIIQAGTHIAAMISDAFLVSFSVFHIIAFDELRHDCKNPVDQCKSLNPLVIPEYALHIFLNFLFLFGSQWLSVIINIPLMVYHIIKYCRRPLMSGYGIYDPTTIMNADNLKKNYLEGWVKFVFYLVTFFYYLLSVVWALMVE